MGWTDGAGGLAPPLAGRLLRLAERDPRRAARLAKALCEDERPCAALDEGWRSYTLGYTLLAWERVGPAQAALLAAQAAFVRADLPALALRCEPGLLGARQLSGEGDSLQAAWAALVSSLDAAGLQREAAAACAEQIVHLNALSRPQQARDLAMASIEHIMRAGTASTKARYQQSAGSAAISCGQLDKGLGLLDQALQGYVALRQPVAAARVRFDRAWAWVRRERYAAARADLTEALATFQRFELPLRMALCEKDLGTVANRLGDYPTAIGHGLRARATFSALGRPDLVARCDLNLGAVAYFSGLIEAADRLYRRAQAEFHGLGSYGLALICQRNRALAACALGQPGLALGLLAASDADRARLGDKLEQAEAELVRGEALRDSGAAAQALAHFAQAAALFATQGNADAVAKCAHERAWAELSLGRFNAAGLSLQAAQAQLAQRPAHAWRVSHGLGLVAEHSGDSAAALAHYTAGAASVARLRGQLASEHASSAIFTRARQLLDDGLRLAVGAGAVELALGLAEQQRGLAFQRQLAAATAPMLRHAGLRPTGSHIASDTPTAQLDAALAAYAHDLLHARHQGPLPPPAVARFDLAELRAALSGAYGEGWTLLVPQVYADQLLMFVIDASGTCLERQPFDSELRELLAQACLPRYRLQTYRDLARLRDAGVQSWAALRALAGRLLSPSVQARLAPTHRLLIVPTGPLYGLPWAALRLEASWLCERAIVEFLPALAAARPPAPLLENLEQPCAALLIGCADFGGRAPELTAALPSLDLVARLWPGPSERLAGPAATRPALRAMAASGALRGYRLIHIASHAQLGLGRGLLGHIKLADSDLHIDEMLGLGLSDALVVLAACDGGAGDVLPGDEVLSISRALLGAGAHSVIASLWQVYDGAMLQLLGPLYRALSEGDDAAAALAQAQRALIGLGASERAVLGSPLIWGGLGVTSLVPSLAATTALAGVAGDGANGVGREPRRGQAANG